MSRAAAARPATKATGPRWSVWRRRVFVSGLTILWLALTFKPVVENDGIFYFAYLRAITVEHDLDFTSEYRAAVVEKTHYDPVLIKATNAAGMPADAFPVGPAVLSLPFYLAAQTAGGSGRPQYGLPYTAAFCLASLLAGLLALALAYRLTLSVVRSEWAALLGVAAATLTTPFVYYLCFEPSYSHTFSAFLAAAFIGWWWGTRDQRRRWQWLVLGLLGGAMAMTRFQDGGFLLIVILDLRGARSRALWLLPGAVAGLAPQLLVDYGQFGTLLPYRSAADALRPLPGHYLDVLLSSHHGLLAWHPGIVAAAVGFVFIRERKLQLAFLIAVIVEILIDGSAPDWDGGFAFGGRRFLVLLPFLVLGYAALAQRIGRRAAAAGFALLATWNVVLMADLTYVISGKQDPGYAGLVLGQLHALAYVPREFVQGAVVRSLALWPVLHQQPNILLGLSLLTFQAVCVAGALAIAVRSSVRMEGSRLTVNIATAQPDAVPGVAATASGREQD